MTDWCCSTRHQHCSRHLQCRLWRAVLAGLGRGQGLGGRAQPSNTKVGQVWGCPPMVCWPWVQCGLLPCLGAS